MAGNARRGGSAFVFVEPGRIQRDVAIRDARASASCRIAGEAGFRLARGGVCAHHSCDDRQGERCDGCNDRRPGFRWRGPACDDHGRPARRPRADRRDALAAPPGRLGAGLAPRRRSCRRARRPDRRHGAALALGAAARDDRPDHRLARLPGPAHRPSADDGAAGRAGRLQRAAARHQRRPRPVRTPGLRAHRRDPPAPGRGPAGTADRTEPRPPPAPGHRGRPADAACAGCCGARHAARRR